MTTQTRVRAFMNAAIALSLRGMRGKKGGPFGAVIVKNGKIVGRGFNRVTSGNDPTAHAEIVAIRDACKRLGTFQLKGCELYTSCEPCPMCLAAIYWARPDVVYYANSRHDAARIGFDDLFIYQELKLPPNKRRYRLTHVRNTRALTPFLEWMRNADKIEY